MMNQDYDRPATQAEAYREWVCNAGSDRPEQAWILTAWDTWEKNPSYTGPDVPHPEFGAPEYSTPPVENEVKKIEENVDNDIPF